MCHTWSHVIAGELISYIHAWVKIYLLVHFVGNRNTLLVVICRMLTKQNSSSGALSNGRLSGCLPHAAVATEQYVRIYIFFV